MSKKLFVKFTPDLITEFHIWEVWMEIGGGRQRIEKFMPQDYETPEDQYDAMIDLVNCCRFSDTEYNVFMDDMLTDL